MSLLPDFTKPYGHSCFCTQIFAFLDTSLCLCIILPLPVHLFWHLSHILDLCAQVFVIKPLPASMSICSLRSWQFTSLSTCSSRGQQISHHGCSGSSPRRPTTSGRAGQMHPPAHHCCGTSHPLTLCPIHSINSLEKPLSAKAFHTSASCILPVRQGPQINKKLPSLPVITGKKLKWATGMWEKGGRSTLSYDQFIELFKRVFDDNTEGVGSTMEEKGCCPWLLHSCSRQRLERTSP